MDKQQKFEEAKAGIKNLLQRAKLFAEHDPEMTQNVIDLVNAGATEEQLRYLLDVSPSNEADSEYVTNLGAVIITLLLNKRKKL